MVQEFRINQFINLKLEKGRTNIYIKNKLFRQCKFLLLEIPKEEINYYDEIATIDKAIEKMDHALKHRKINIPPHIEFWGHCSNLQVWYENNYDTRFLSMNLAFPLLKELTKVGDVFAEQVFKEEIAKRLSSDDKNTINFLIEEGYSKYLNHEDFISSILDHKEMGIMRELELRFKTKIDFIHELKYKGQHGFMVNNKHIIYLSLPSNNIKKIPEEIVKLSHLEYLDMSFNEIENIPNSFRKLKKLKILNLEKNKIKHIPEIIGELQLLKILNLIDNLITVIPDSIGKLKNLRKLNLSINNISILPESIGNLKSLKSLKLNSNLIKELPDSFGNLKYLKELYLGYNKLESLPNSIGNLLSLKYLYLEHNILSKVPDTLGKLNILEFIHLNDNNIESIPDSFGFLNKLKTLNLKNNKIKKKENIPQSLIRDGLNVNI